MTQYVINIGAIPNDGTGDPLRTAFNETNLNFDQVFAAGPVLSNIQIANNTVLTTNTNGNLILAPNGTAVVQSNVSILPNLANLRNLGSATQRWATIYAQSLNVSSGTSVNGNLTVDGNLIVMGNVINMGNIVTDTLTIQLANTTTTANAANGAGITVGATDDIATLLYNSTSNVWTTNIGVSSVGNISAPYFFGNGSQLTGIISSYGNANVAAYLPTYSGNIGAGNVGVSGAINAVGEITSFANIVASPGGYFIGDGSQLTGLPAGYANANAVAYGESGWAGNIVPSGNAVYSLGNATNQWNDLYVSNTTIYMNNVPITLGAGNVLTVNGNAVLQNNSNSTISTTGNITADYFFGDGSQLTGISTANIGNVTFDDINIIGTGNLNLQPNGASNEYLNIYLTGNADIHVAAGGSGGNVILGTDEQANVAVLLDGNVAIQAGNVAGTKNWTFDTAGNLTLPMGGVVYETNIPDGALSGSAIALTPPGGTNADQQLLIYPTVNDANHLHLTTGNLYNTELFLGNDNLYVKLANTGNIVVNSNNGAGNAAQWTFDYLGNLTTPGHLSVNGNIIATESGFFTGNSASGDGALYAGIPGYVPIGPGTVAQFIGDTHPFDPSYSQINFQNVRGNASADWVATASNGDDNSYYIDMGINGSTYSEAVFFGDTSSANDGYLYVVGNSQNGPGNSNVGNLLVGSTNGVIKLFVGNTAQANVVQTVTTTGIGINGNISASGNVSTGNLVTTGTVSANNIGNIASINLTGNANTVLYGNGVFALPAASSSYGNSNVATFLAAYGSNTISTTGNITAGNFVGNISITGNVQGTTANVTLVAGSYNWTFDNTGNLTLPGNTFAVNYANNTPVDVVTRFESSWTVPVGNSTQSFTVTASNTYYMWVDCNIPNGILTWNATASITNTNVPVVGAQYAWVYTGGGTPIDFTSIPNQFVGTANTIIRSSVAPSATTNRFDFGINNTSGNSQTVRYGWIQIS